MNNNLLAYTTIVREATIEERLLFAPPPKRAPKELTQMSQKLMASINDTFWVEEDRTRLFELIQSNVPATVLIIDCTFEVARVAKEHGIKEAIVRDGQSRLLKMHLKQPCPCIHTSSVVSPFCNVVRSCLNLKWHK